MLPVQTFDPKSSVNLPEVFQAALLSNIADAVISTDKNFRVLTWNKAAETIYGIPATEAIGSTAQKLFDYIYVSSTREEALASLLQNHQWKGVVKYLRADGKEVLLEACVTEIISDAGQLLGYVAVNRDITEVAEIRLCLEGLKCTFGHINEGVALIDKQDKVRFFNNKANKIMKAIGCEGFSLNDNFTERFPLDRQTNIKEHLALAWNGIASAYETSYDKGDQNTLFLDVRYCPIKNEYNEVNYVGVLIKNTTKQKREHELTDYLTKSRLLFEEFMNNSQFVAWIVNDQGIVRYLNQTFLQEFKLSRNYLNKPIDELFPAQMASQYLHNNEETLRNGKGVKSIEDAVLPNGEVKTFKVIRFPIYSEDETLVGGWAADISDDLEAIFNWKNGL